MNRQLAKQYFNRAEAALEAGNAEEALTLLNQLDAAFPNTKNIGVARARAYASMGRIPEAVKLCDHLVDQHDSRRARELKEQLLLGVIEPNVPRPATKAAKKVRSFRKALVVYGAIAVICMIVAAISIAHYMDLRPSSNTESEVERKPRLRLEAVTQSIPGLIHHPGTWELDSAGVPKWKSGVFRGVPCINEPKRTIDVYLPLVYDAKPETRFPGVVIQMAGGNPGFIGLEEWAERCEVILIVINSSRNKTFAQNHIAQDRALETVSTSLRVDQQMGFAIGMSGGGRASWQVACRYPENFMGIVMMGISGDEDVFMPPTHVRVAFIHGETDFNNRSTASAIRLLTQLGYEVRERVVPGGHVPGPVQVRIEMLNWMVFAARRDLGLPQPSG